MTAQVVAAVQKSVDYGMRELRSLSHRYASIGLAIAAVLHLLAIGGFYLAQSLGDDDAIVTLHCPTLIDITVIQPPIGGEDPTRPQVKYSLETAGPEKGIPVPVPDAEVSPEKTIASQTEMNPALDPSVFEGVGKGTVVFQHPLAIDDEAEPAPFVPVEKEPTVVTSVIPEYPEIARIAGVEGTVFVRMLVDRQGRVKKALVDKSDVEIFNEPAIAAALKYLFTPAVMNNGPVPVWVTIPFRFRLNK